MKLSEICIVKTWSKRFNTHGKLSLLHVNDTIHVVEYKDTERSIAVDVDFVELSSLDSTIRFTFPRGSGDRLVFKVDDEAEFSILCQAKEDCQAICDLKLRLNSIMRDSYYSGVYSNLDPDAKLVLCEEMDRLKKENPGLYFSSLLNSNEVRVDMANRLPKQIKPAADSNSIHLSEVVCVFCAASKLAMKDLDFVIHPNVPKSSTGRSNYMCSICIENWKEYREIAEHEGQLVLPGEVNEEICAICSDTPSTLVLCGECPRSFCNNCLSRVLQPAEYAELMSSDDVDWICVCCNAGVSRNPPLARTAWKMVGLGNGKRGGHHAYGTIVPYSKTAQNAAISKALLLSASELQDTTVDAAVAHSAPMFTSLANCRGTSSGAPSAVTTPGGHELDEEDNNSLVAPRRRAAQAKLLEKTPPPPPKAARTGSGKGAKYEEVDTLVTLQAQNKAASSHNNRNKRMEKRYRGQPEGGSSDGGDAPTAPAALDEKYYFTQYVGYYSLLCEDVIARQTEAAAMAAMKGKPGKRKRIAEILTDDVCFLCKDGGELIECDWQCPSAKNGERCLKVYHTYCLTFDVSDEKWCCPRHYCDMCGSQTLKYICKYCPVSICASCPEKMVAKYGNARYCAVNDPLAGVWCHTPNAPGMQSIVCQSCTEMLEQITTPVEGVPARKEITITSNSMTGIKGSAPFSVLQAEIQNQKRFPGTYQGDGLGGSNKVFNREIAGGSSDERTSASSTTEQIVIPQPRKQHAKGKTHKRGASTRWTDEECEALLEAVEVHGDDAHAVKADPEFAARLSRRTEESIKLKMERENMFGDSAGEDSEGEGEEGGERDETEGVKKSSEKASVDVQEEMDVVDTPEEKEEECKAAAKNEVRNEMVEPETEPSGDTEPSVASTVGKGKGGRAKPPSAVRSDSASVTSAAAASVKPSSASTSPRGRPSSAASASLPDDVSVASSHRSASSRLTSTSTAAVISSRSSPRYSAPVEEVPVEKPASGVPAATRTSTTGSTTSSSAKKGAVPPAKVDEPKPKAKNFELKSLLSNNVQPLPPRRKGPPTAPPAVPTSSSAGASASKRAPAAAEKSDSESGSDDEVETIQVPRILTRRQEQEQEQALLSTRSGKKLYLAGSDLLP